tara:strand:- start:354 stop:581 length:228 start_codon:yes stop_codon:yes gene_type:complete
MFVKNLYVMAVINNMHIKSHFIENVFSYKYIYKYFENYYKKKVILVCEDNKHLHKNDLKQIINWEHESLFLRVFY